MCWKNNVKIKKIDTNTYVIYYIILYYIVILYYVILYYICYKQGKRKTRHE